MSDPHTPPAPTRLRKRSLQIAGHRTSVSLEDAFWAALGDIAAARGISLAGLVAEVDASRGAANLSSAIRVFVLLNARAAYLGAGGGGGGDRGAEAEGNWKGSPADGS